MSTDVPPDIWERLCKADSEALAEAFAMHRDRLWRTIHFRMDRRLSGRLDPEDVLQEAYMNAASRLSHYLDNTDRSFFVWLRLIVLQTLVDVHRRHFGAGMRDVGREISLQRGLYPLTTSVALAEQLAGDGTSPSQAALRAERMQRLEQAIASMSELDQEILALRHFEGLSNLEVAEILQLNATAASNRYVRAVARLRQILLDNGWDASEL